MFCRFHVLPAHWRQTAKSYGLQVSDNASIQRAVAYAGPRQAVALSIAHWELATKTASILGGLPPSRGQASFSPAAGSLLLLSSLVSKASCTVRHPLPVQAMDAWQHATWPTGDSDLLCLAAVLAVEQLPQGLADKASDKNGSKGGPAGTHQQAVVAAAALLAQLDVSVSEALASAAAADNNSDDRQHSPGFVQSQGSHPAVIGAVAVRVFQLSTGNPNAAMAILVASVLPDWDYDLPEAHEVEAGMVQQGSAAIANGQMSDSEGELTPSALATRRARQRSYRKRARSASRCVPTQS